MALGAGQRATLYRTGCAGHQSVRSGHGYGGIVAVAPETMAIGGMDPGVGGRCFSVACHLGHGSRGFASERSSPLSVGDWQGERLCSTVSIRRRWAGPTASPSECGGKHHETNDSNDRGSRSARPVVRVWDGNPSKQTNLTAKKSGRNDHTKPCTDSHILF